MADLSEDELKALIRSAKPAFTARGTTTDPNRDPTFRVIYDGHGAWMIDRPTITELRVGGRTIVVEGDTVEVFDPPAILNNDVKSALDGRRIAYLDEGSLELIGTTTGAGRPCFVVRAWGLKRGRDEPFELAVDIETGAILRMRGDGETLFEVTEFRVGTPAPDAQAPEQLAREGGSQGRRP